jgi:uncharacterized DUF497 family protein
VVTNVTQYVTHRNMELNWDDNNVAYIGKSHGKIRYIVLGQTRGGRYLTVVVERLYNTFFRPVTAFEMSEAYRQRYIKRMGTTGGRN